MIFSQKISSKFPPHFFLIRLLATGVYLFFLVLTMFLAFYPHKIFARGLLLVISIAIQFLALCKCPILSCPVLSCPVLSEFLIRMTEKSSFFLIF
jgi:hypothetical protein